MNFLIAAIFFIFLLNGCGQKEDTPPPKLFEDQRKALDQAREVNVQQQEEADKQRKELEKLTQ